MVHLLARLLLHFLHYIYALSFYLRSFRKSTSPSPQPLKSPRTRLPSHLAILFITRSDSFSPSTRDSLLQSVLDAVNWCRVVGIPKLTVYDRHGILLGNAQLLQERVSNLCESDNSDSNESDLEYPLTPPPSDYSESRPLSPEGAPQQENATITINIPSNLPWKRSNVRTKGHVNRKQREAAHKQFALCISSRASSKPAIAAAARSLILRYDKKGRRNAREPIVDGLSNITVETMDTILEGNTNISAPDFLILQHAYTGCSSPTPPELHGFPPWQIRLTEFYSSESRPEKGPRSNKSVSELTLDEWTFREALDEFATAEMRFGK